MRTKNPGGLCARCSRNDVTGTQSWCSACKYEKGSHEYRKAASVDYWRPRYLFKKHGITVEEYDAMLQEQDGVCAICQGTETYGNSSHLRVDHDHLTGDIRALLCDPCNMMLGKAKDNPEVLEAAAKYVRHYTEMRPTT